MASSESAVSELLEAFRAGQGVDLIRESVRMVLQELIAAEAAEVIGAAATSAPHRARPRAMVTGTGGCPLRPGMCRCESRSCVRAGSSR